MRSAHSLLLFLLAWGLFACSKPIVAFHWNAKEAAMVRKSRTVAKSSYGYPKHKWYSYAICFNKNCIAKAKWKHKQHNDRFKGFKNNKLLQTKPTVQEPDAIAAQKTKSGKDTLPFETEKTIVLKDILFKVNSTELNHSFSAPLDSLVQVLRQHPALKIKIHGHTDKTGDETRNVRLSRERAGAIAAYLIDQGIATRSIDFQGFGSSKPIANNDSHQGRSQNRRVEVLLCE